MKKIILGILIGLGLTIAGIAIAVNVTVPQALQVGNVPCGLSSGNYASCKFINGTNITIATSTPGQITISASGGSGNSAWLFGNGFIYNATSTPTSSDTIMIGTSTKSSLFVANQALLGIQGLINNYLESNIQNLSNGTLASSNYTATANNGSATTYYAELGINSSGFTNIGGISGGPDDGYLYNSDNSLLVGTASSTNSSANLYLVSQNTNVATFTPTTQIFKGSVGIGTTTPTATLQVQGSGSNNPFTVASSSGASYLTVLANGNVGIGTSNPLVPLGLHIQTSGTNTAELAIENTGSNGVSASMYFLGAVNGGNSYFGFRNNASFSIGTTTAVNNAISSILTVNNNGNVGIGTTTPGSNLQIQGASGQTNSLFTISSSTGVTAFTIDKDGRVTIGTQKVGTALTITSSGDAAATAFQVNGDSQYGTAFALNNTSPSGRTWALTSQGNGNTNVGDFLVSISGGYPGLQIDPSNNVQLGGLITLNTPTLTILAANKVGVNTTSPTTSLFVQGTGSTNPFAIASSTGTQLLTVLANGNIGVGTTTPGAGLLGGSYPLQIVGNNSNGITENITNLNASSASILEFGTNTTQEQGGFFAGGSSYNGYGGNNSFNIINALNAPVTFGTNNAVKLTITGAGNVGIGTTTPSQLLTVYGNLLAATSSTYTLFANTATQSVSINTSTTANVLTVQGTQSRPTIPILNIASSSGASYLTVFADGGIGIGTTTDATTTVINQGSNLSVGVDNGTTTVNFLIDWGKGNTQGIVISSSTTLTMSWANLRPGYRGALSIYQDGTGSRLINWPAQAHFSGGTAPTLTTTAGQHDDFSIVCPPRGNSTSCTVSSGILNVAP